MDPWIRQMWKEAQAEKHAFIKRVSDIEIAYLRKHKRTKRDVHFIWLDELLIGIEVRGKESKVYYENELG